MYFRFQQPEFIALLILVAIAFWLKRNWGKPASLRFSSNWAINQIIRHKRTKIRQLLYILRAMVLVLVVLALMRPQTGRKWTETSAEGVDIMLAIDLSGSMHAHDFNLDGKLVSRLEMVKHVVSDFIDKRPHDRSGLVGFAQEPYLVSPRTRNHTWHKEYLNRLEIGLIASNSTAIGSAIGLATNRLRNIPGESRVLILMTDGENNAGRLPPLAASKIAESFDIKIYTIGVGKTGSVLMPRIRNNQYVLNEKGNPIMDWTESEIDESTLREIANQTAGYFYRATNSESIQNIYDEIDELERREITYVRHDEAKELMQYPMIVALILLLIEILLARTILNKVP